MLEQINEQTNYQDLNTPKPENSAPGLELAQNPETEKIRDNIADIKSAIDANQPVTSDQVVSFRKALDHLVIDADGKQMTLQEYQSDPDIGNTLKVIKEIEADKLDWERVSGINYLDPALARRLIDLLPGDHHLSLENLTTLSPQTAKVLSTFTGPSIGLYFLTQASPEVIRNFQGYLSHQEFGNNLAFGFETLTPAMAQELAALNRHITLDRLSEISDEIINIFGHGQSTFTLSSRFSNETTKIDNIKYRLRMGKTS